MLHLLVLAAISTLSVGASPAQKASMAPPHHPMGSRLTVKGIPNFGRVSANLYRGGVPNDQGLKVLKEMGFDVVVDMRRGQNKTEQDTVTKMGMKYVSIPSRCPFPSDEPWARFLKVMRENQDKKVFVHCRLGDDRTGMAVVAYRISEEGWSGPEALQEMKTFGFSALHRAICPGLEGYAEEFPKRLKESPAFRELSSQNLSQPK